MFVMVNFSIRLNSSDPGTTFYSNFLILIFPVFNSKPNDFIHIYKMHYLVRMVICQLNFVKWMMVLLKRPLSHYWTSPLISLFCIICIWFLHVGQRTESIITIITTKQMPNAYICTWQYIRNAAFHSDNNIVIEQWNNIHAIANRDMINKYLFIISLFRKFFWTL